MTHHSFVIVLPGEVRHTIPVAIDIGAHVCTLTSFLLRGPRDAAAAASLHRVLLRKNAATMRIRFVLDVDDDVVLQGRLPLEHVDAAEVDAALGELYTLAEGGFEPLVHLAYPGVFPAVAPATALGRPMPGGGVAARVTSTPAQPR